MLPELVRALPAAVAVGVLPGWFWARVLWPGRDPAERLACSVALSFTLVPTSALLLARLFESGITLPVAILSVVAVFFGGLGAFLRFGAAGAEAKGSNEGPLVSRPLAVGYPTLVVVVVGTVVALMSMVGMVEGWRVAPLIALLVLLGGVSHLLTWLPRRARERPAVDSSGESAGSSRRRVLSAVRWLAFAAVCVLILVRAYAGPLRYDWPFPRGVDRFEHAVMADMMLSQGTTESFMLYPPGLHVLTALASRLSGLEPLELFAIFAPALLLLVALASYVVAARLWGWEFGLAAAVFCGLITNGPYEHISHARYANIVAAQFLLVLALGALFRLYASGAARDGLTLAILGSSVVLYHQVASLYEATLLALVAALFVPYLLVHERRKALALLASFALLGVLAVLFAWDTYDLGRLVVGILGGTDTSKGGEAVGMALGTKPPFPLEHVLLTATQPLLWLGLLGVLLLVVDGRRSEDAVADVLARTTLLFWSLLMFAGSQTALSGFPDRFERDLGIPLALLSALALVAVVRSPVDARGPAAHGAAVLAVIPVAALVMYGAAHNLAEADGPAERDEDRAPPPRVVAAGEWLGENNEGGRILATPYFGPTSARGMLAMGGYHGMQAYTEKRILKARDLPPFGAEPLWDVLWVVNHPEGERTRRVLRENDVRYIVLNKHFPGAGWLRFNEREDLYRTVFENDAVIIFEPRRTG